MNVVIFYKKKSSKQSIYAWREVCSSPIEAVNFMDRMGEDEYDFVPFEQVDIKHIEDLADELANKLGLEKSC